MSEFQPDYDENTGASYYSRDDGSREDVRSRESDRANSPVEDQAQAEDEGWREADFQVEEPENNGDSELSDEQRHRSRGNRWKNRLRPYLPGSKPHHGKKCRGKRCQPSCHAWRVYPPQQVKSAENLQNREYRPPELQEQSFQFIVGRRTYNLLKKLTGKTSHAVSDKGDCNFLAMAWESRENQTDPEEKFIHESKDSALDADYYEELVNKKKQRKYKEMYEFRKTLPAHKLKNEIVSLINNHQVSFISGGTGCGKTTQIVQFVLDDWIMSMKGSQCNIVCTQPRRVCASSIAERIAAERLEPLSLSVGYQIRFENKLAERKVGCINFVTIGVLLQWLVTNRLLSHVSHIFLDEVHEKTIEFDAVMAMLRTIVQERRDLKVILMSATIDSDSFCKYFGDAPNLEIPGYTFPVEDIYVDDIIKITNYKAPVREVVLNYDQEFDFEEDIPFLDDMVDHLAFRESEELNFHLLAHLIGYICMNEEDGAILVFLPGLSDIMRVKKKIQTSPWYSPDKHLIVGAHSLIPSEAQQHAFVIPPRGKRKIVLATSIMETSVTLDDMSYVVDTGKIKFSSFDTTLKISSLNSTWITTANAKQRRGRIGRTKPGKCYKLYSREKEASFIPYPPTDMQLNTLERVILHLKLLKISRVHQFLNTMMDPPPSAMVQLALTELRQMNALNDDERLTALGYHLARLPLDVRTGKMILMGALFSCVDPIFSIAACLSFKDPFMVSVDEDKLMSVKESYSSWEISDHVIFMEILRDWEDEKFTSKRQFCTEKYLSESSLNQISEAKRQFAKVLHGMNFMPSADVKDPANNVNSKNADFIKAIVCAGLYPSVATLARKTRSRGIKTLEGQFAEFHGKSLLSQSPEFFLPFFVYFYILQTSTKVFIHDASMIEVLPLIFFGRDLEIVEVNNTRFLQIDNKLKFKFGLRPALMLKTVKDRLDQVLGKALLNSEGFDWNRRGKEMNILRGVVGLILNSDIIHKVDYGH